MVKEQLAENQLSPEITLGCTGKIRSQSTQQRQDGNLLLVNMVNNLALPVSILLSRTHKNFGVPCSVKIKPYNTVVNLVELVAF